jgi:hypothetical protein
MDVGKRLSSSTPASAQWPCSIISGLGSCPNWVPFIPPEWTFAWTRTTSVATNAGCRACCLRGGLWSGVSSGRNAAKFELKTRDPLASVLVALVAGGRASAESTIESIGLVGSVQCDAFRQNQNASWTSTGNSVVTIGPSRLAVGGGTTFEKEGTSRRAVSANTFG